ncbi:hypothetical protein OH77DRAFT_1420014 [Trametes cingulata]|nr:hypothetical protein OH77DRAFT_1420014 [Trametes cingulata]
MSVSSKGPDVQLVIDSDQLETLLSSTQTARLLSTLQTGHGWLNVIPAHLTSIFTLSVEPNPSKYGLWTEPTPYVAAVYGYQSHPPEP